MISHLSPVLKRVATEVRPQDLLLTKGAWVRFSDKFPDPYKWAKGKLFEVEKEPLIVPYAASYTLPGSDYKDVDLSNSTAGIKLYPESEGVIYECLIGLKPGEYLVHIYITKDKYVYALGESTMYPQIGDASKKYLGAFKPEDTPAECPLLKLYFINAIPAFILRFYVLESVDFDKCTALLWLNKCRLQEVAAPTKEQVDRAKLISWAEELTAVY